MHTDLDLLGQLTKRPAVIDAFDIVAVARASGLYANATDHTVAILSTCRDACYHDDQQPEWLAGFRILTRTIVYVSARRYPGDSVISLTVTE
jgi:hypothetical protein